MVVFILVVVYSSRLLFLLFFEIMLLVLKSVKCLGALFPIFIFQICRVRLLILTQAVTSFSFCNHQQMAFAMILSKAHNKSQNVLIFEKKSSSTPKPDCYEVKASMKIYNSNISPL